jgi:two-component system alkaline phosphatase synthesis response regulator PhoP
MKRRILVVEDDASLARVLCDNLIYEGFDVAHAGDGRRALDQGKEFKPDLVLLDLALPGLDGFEVCRRLAGEQSRTAVIMLTARGQRQDKIEGLKLGADDYITKPFALDELLARIHAVLRRVHPSDNFLALGSLQIDFTRYTATQDGQKVAFSQREFEVLQYMYGRSGKVVTREELLKNVWGYQNVPLTRSVDNLIARLRLKIEQDPDNPRYIHTVYGDGYRLTP